MVPPRAIIEVLPVADWIEEKLYAKHGVTMDEVDEAVEARVEVRALGRDGRGEMRYRIVGRTVAGRWLTVIVVFRTASAVSVLSARDATGRERRSAWRGS